MSTNSNSSNSMPITANQWLEHPYLETFPDKLEEGLKIILCEHSKISHLTVATLKNHKQRIKIVTLSCLVLAVASGIFVGYLACAFVTALSFGIWSQYNKFIIKKEEMLTGLFHRVIPDMLVLNEYEQKNLQEAFSTGLCSLLRACKLGPDQKFTIRQYITIFKLFSVICDQNKETDRPPLRRAKIASSLMWREIQHILGITDATMLPQPPELLHRLKWPESVPKSYDGFTDVTDVHHLLNS